MNPFSFNLWYGPWIRLTHSDGTFTELGIFDCLVNAHALAALSDPSPLVAAGTHRLLAAILQAIYQPQYLNDLERLIQEGKFDAARLEAFATHYANRFDLFDAIAPFMQTGDVPLTASEASKSEDDYSPVSRLFAEVPTETNRTLFQHVTDDSHTVCPACCARGIITIPSFASSGGKGLRPSINGVPPVYVLPIGQSLFESLALSVLISEKQPRKAVRDERGETAPWNWPAIVAKNEQITSVGYIESLLFPARRLRLLPMEGPINCTQCGKATDQYVSHILYEMGHWLDTKEIGPWDDPFVAFQSSNNKQQGTFPIRPREGKAMWREFSGLFLVEADRASRPMVVSQIKDLVNDTQVRVGSAIQVRCVWMRTDGKAKIFEWGDEALEAPAALLRVKTGETNINTALAHSEEVRERLYKCFGTYFAKGQIKRDANRERFRKLRDRMQADYWQTLAAPFRGFVIALAEALQRDDESHYTLLEAWDDILIQTGLRAFDSAVDQFGNSADAIRVRVITKDNCRRTLYSQKKKWNGFNDN
ncbi:MAG: type I-E CRISPR-associated protein Cse1/CasA [Aggregatilineales bacterium]